MIQPIMVPYPYSPTSWVRRSPAPGYEHQRFSARGLSLKLALPPVHHAGRAEESTPLSNPTRPELIWKYRSPQHLELTCVPFAGCPLAASFPTLLLVPASSPKQMLLHTCSQTLVSGSLLGSQQWGMEGLCLRAARR